MVIKTKDMTLKPKIFNTEEVRSILVGTMTEFRQEIKPQPNFDSAWKNLGLTEDIPVIRTDGGLLGINETDGGGVFTCVPNITVPYHPKDLIYVRETFNDQPQGYCLYKADCPIIWDTPEGKIIQTEKDWKWKSPVKMRRDQSRLTLEVLSIRVERTEKWYWVVEFKVIKPC